MRLSFFLFVSQVHDLCGRQMYGIIINWLLYRSCMSNKSTLIPSSLIVLFSLTLTTSIPLPMIIDKKQIAYGNSATNQDHSNSNNIQFSSIGLEMPANKLSADLGIINSNFTTLFDGKTLDGWKMAGHGRFVVIEEDGSVESEGGMG